MVQNKLGIIIENVWQSLPEQFAINLDKFQIMPNHLHGILIIKPKITMIAGAINCAPTKNDNVGFNLLNPSKRG